MAAIKCAAVPSARPGDFMHYAAKATFHFAYFIFPAAHSKINFVRLDCGAFTAIANTDFQFRLFLTCFIWLILPLAITPFMRYEYISMLNSLRLGLLRHLFCYARHWRDISYAHTE